MRASPVCPRCGSPLSPPGIWADDWMCARHGPVQPLAPAHPPATTWLRDVASRSSVPVWLPWPLPRGWLLAGVSEAGNPRTGPTATVVALSGPNPAPDPADPSQHPADLLLVAEQPGTGLGARLAGLDAVDPGESVVAGAPQAKVRAGGHPTALWNVGSAPDRATYVGEAGGVWLWLVLWPATAGVMVLEPLDLVDVRSADAAVEPPAGAPSRRLP